MSDVDTAIGFDSGFDGGDVPEGDPTYDGGQVDSDGGEERSYFDPEPYADTLVRVKVSGEEVEVPLADALAGYQRQADYTRKTQELAAERQQLEFARTLQQALEANPAQTLALLQEQYGLSRQQAEDMLADDDDDWMADPVEKKLRGLEQEFSQRFEQMDRFFAQQQLERQIQQLQQTYGDEFNPKEVVSEALRLGIDDLDLAYRQMAFNRYWAQTQAQKDHSEAQAAEMARREAAKQRTSGVHTGGSSAGAAPVAPAAPTSIREAWAQAKAELGY
jgi:hypothetical protein